MKKYVCACCAYIVVLVFTMGLSIDVSAVPESRLESYRGGWFSGVAFSKSIHIVLNLIDHGNDGAVEILTGENENANGEDDANEGSLEAPEEHVETNGHDEITNEVSVEPDAITPKAPNEPGEITHKDSEEPGEAAPEESEESENTAEADESVEEPEGFGADVGDSEETAKPDVTLIEDSWGDNRNEVYEQSGADGT